MIYIYIFCSSGLPLGLQLSESSKDNLITLQLGTGLFATPDRFSRLSTGRTEEEKKKTTNQEDLWHTDDRDTGPGRTCVKSLSDAAAYPVYQLLVYYIYGGFLKTYLHALYSTSHAVRVAIAATGRAAGRGRSNFFSRLDLWHNSYR